MIRTISLFLYHTLETDSSEYLQVKPMFDFTQYNTHIVSILQFTYEFWHMEKYYKTEKGIPSTENGCIDMSGFLLSDYILQINLYTLHVFFYFFLNFSVYPSPF